MLDEILPVQFIEGVNEFEGPAGEKGFGLAYDQTAAFEYHPAHSYTINSAHIWTESWTGPAEIEISICAHNHIEPGDIVLGSQRLRLSRKGWQEFSIGPFVLLATGTYWLVIQSLNGEVNLPNLSAGQELTVLFKRENRWIQTSVPTHMRPRIRFYGRFLPSLV
jgi:hypothetical protein